MRAHNRGRGGRAWAAVAFAAVCALAGGCATAPPPPGPDLVWPDPPAAPRIRYVRSIHSAADVGLRRGAPVRFWHWLVGLDEETRLVKPFGIALDEQGLLCLTDTATRSVIVVDTEEKRWRHWDRVGGTAFVTPVAVAKRGDTLYVADSGLGAVIAFTDNGRLIGRFTNRLVRPVGLVLQDDRLLVADAGRHCVVELSLAGEPVGEFGERGDGPGQFNFPTHLAVDGAGRVYVTDSVNGRIQVFDRERKPVATVGQSGTAVGCFSRPKGVAVDGAGHVYVVDSNFDNVQIFDLEGRILLPLGSAGSEPGQFWLPNGIAIGAGRDIYVADCYNRRVQVFQYVGQP